MKVRIFELKKNTGCFKMNLDKSSRELIIFHVSTHLSPWYVFFLAAITFHREFRTIPIMVLKTKENIFENDSRKYLNYDIITCQLKQKNCRKLSTLKGQFTSCLFFPNISPWNS